MTLKRRDFIAGVGGGTLAAALAATQGNAADAAGQPLLEPARGEGSPSADLRGAGAKPLAAGPPLSPAWLASLFERGQPTEYRKKDFSFIGMPIGGLTTGQLYLGGDGQLWLWDIFNQTPPAEQPGAVHYSCPLTASYFGSLDADGVLLQGFTLRVDEPAGARAWPLSSAGFNDISFRGQYPIGFVDYRDKACPLSVHLEAFSPFIPLNVDDSSLPATVMRFTLTNTSATAVTGELTGLIENAVARSVNHYFSVRRINRVERTDEYLYVDCRAEVDSSKTLPDQGSMGLVLLCSTPADQATAAIAGRPEQRPAGTLTRSFTLAPDASHTVTFALVWYFPNLSIEWSMGRPPLETVRLKADTRRHYVTRFDSAGSVVRYLSHHLDRLCTQTQLWHHTWYTASTLPHWFLERTLLNVSTLATSTAYRFADGRFYGMEGAGGGQGTVTHVWHYEQAMGRLFPELDIALREHADLNPEISLKPDGRIESRGELYDDAPAVDGQAGTILRALRNHQTSADDAFLKRNWPHIKKATQWMIAQDGNDDGIWEGPQANTLDGVWYGAIAWLSGLYLAALRAAEEMARDVGDTSFARRCRGIFERGRRNIVDKLFSDEYFINLPDPRHPESLNSGRGCEIDQVLGQSWAFQVALGRVLPEKEAHSALSALWRYNFKPEVGSYRARNPAGRWYALPGESGLLMCAFPGTGDDAKALGTETPGNPAGYFNECMTGFEHQVAGHMLWEGLVKEGLAIERAIHDRYHGSKRNPWNEVEAGDHYARAMASYGVYIAACGFEYHGPKGHMAFAPRLTPENFQAAFTAAEGWGQYRQHIDNGQLVAEIQLVYGQLRIRSLDLKSLAGTAPSYAAARVNKRAVKVGLSMREHCASLRFSNAIELKTGDRLTMNLRAT